MGLIAVNIIGLIMFILAIVMFVLADSMVGIAIGVAISVVWLTFTIYSREDARRRSSRTVPGDICLMHR